MGDILEKAGVLKRDSLIYLKERVEKRLGIRGFDEIVIVEIEELAEEERKKRETETAELPPEFYQFLKRIKRELPSEGRT